jgi:hypothetical protein
VLLCCSSDHFSKSLVITRSHYASCHSGFLTTFGLRARLHKQFCIRIPIRFGVQFAAKDEIQVMFLLVCANMC